MLVVLTAAGAAASASVASPLGGPTAAKLLVPASASVVPGQAEVGVFSSPPIVVRKRRPVTDLHPFGPAREPVGTPPCLVCREGREPLGRGANPERLRPTRWPDVDPRPPADASDVRQGPHDLVTAIDEDSGGTVPPQVPGAVPASRDAGRSGSTPAAERARGGAESEPPAVSSEDRPGHSGAGRVEPVSPGEASDRGRPEPRTDRATRAESNKA